MYIRYVTTNVSEHTLVGCRFTVLETSQSYLNNMTLPVLDLSKYTRGSTQEQGLFSHDLLSSFQSYGFVKLVNHGFAREYIDELMNWVGGIALIPLGTYLV